jgi:peptidoglycan/LPS O-acetylase OafA/YrhL
MKVLNRNFGLDVIRMLAIWLVLLQHGGYQIIPNLKGLKIGGFGVEIFFVLSGFLIGGILLKSLSKENSLKSVWRFWVRRWFRILPVYYLMLLIKFLFFDSSIGVDVFYYVFFLQNNFYGIQFYEVTWSLVIEEWFYIISPLVISVIYKLGKTNRIRLIGLLSFLFMILMFRVYYVYAFDVSYGGVNGNVPFRLDSLFYGVVLAFIKINYNKMYQYLSKHIFLIVSLVFLVGYLMLISYWGANSISIDDSFFARTIGFSFVSFFATLLIPFFEVNIKSSKSHLISKSWYMLVTYTSLWTFAIYLIHPLVLSMGMFDSFSGENTTVSFILSMVLTYLLSAVVYYGYESQWLKLREKIAPGRTKAVN